MKPAPRTLAFLGLWVALLAVILWRRLPPAPVEVLPPGSAPLPLTVDLNRDPWERLTLIDGIGETLARRIVAAREACGGFRNLREVMEVPGVPDHRIAEAESWLTVSSEPQPSEPQPSEPLPSEDLPSEDLAAPPRSP